MKPVLIALGVLLLAVLGFVWMNKGVVVKPNSGQNTGDRQIFWEPEGKVEVGKEKTFEVKANFLEGGIASFNLEFQYDSTVIKVDEVKVNKDIFDQVVVEEINENFGKIRIQARSSQSGTNLAGGISTLATVKISGLKKGGMIISGGRRPEVGVWGNEKVSEGNFQFSGFKVTVL
jgi:hypothetical protein